MATHRADRRRSNDGLDWFSGGLKGVGMEFTTGAEVLAHNRNVRNRLRSLTKIVQEEPVSQSIEIKCGNPGDGAVCGTYYSENPPQKIPMPYYTGSNFPKLHHIRRVAAEFYRVDPLELVSTRRTAEIVRPRQIHFYLARKLTPRSLPDIGRECGKKDHTSVMHGFRKIDAMVRAGHPIQNDIEEIKRRIMSRVVERSRSGVEILAA
jgi:hypothetical protein